MANMAELDSRERAKTRDLAARLAVIPGSSEQYASHWGAALTVAAVTSILRSVELGSRESYVDMLAELLEGDPHAHGILRKLYSAIANSQWALHAAQVEDDADAELAEEIAKDTQSAIAAIPKWQDHVFGMLWAHYYGATCREVMWRREPTRWGIRSLERVHSRRIAYDTDFRPYASESAYSGSGIVFDEYPAKFLVFEPSVVEDYPTRQGLGRVLAYWMSFKRFGARDLLGYTERFGKPFPVATWSTSSDGNPRPATAADIAVAKEIVRYIGKGSQPGAAVPDSIKLEILRATGSAGSSGGDATVHGALVKLCNDEISKAVLAGTLTTEVGQTGSRALGTVMQQGEREVAAALAKQWDGCVTNGLVRWYVTLNYGEEAAVRLCPSYVTEIEQPDDLREAAETLEKLVGMGLSVVESEVRERFGWRAPIEGEAVLEKAAAPAPAPPPVAEPDTEVEDPADEEDDAPEEDTEREET